MRKRKNSEEDSEMEVDNEEIKAEVVDDDDDDDEEMGSADGTDQSDKDEDDVIDNDDKSTVKSTERPASVAENPFLDSFYSLSAPDPKERSRAGQVMLFHCLLGPSANSKDAAYAFRRLLNGLCSGRAASRQGNASAFASLLKIAFQLEKMDEIRSEAENNSENNSSSLLSYVQDRLLSATDPQITQGKKKGSEERDYHFGRLFGILGVVRSGILLLPGDDGDIKEVTTTLLNGLVELFWHKRWMREPAAHGITTMLNLFFGSERKAIQKIGWHLVEEVIVPKVLMITPDGKSEASDFQTIMEKYCAEQIGVGAYIQSRSHSNDLPFPLDQPIISTKTLPWIGQALSQTSVIVQPRTHFVWDALWCYLTVKDGKDKPSQKEKGHTSSWSKYCIRKTIPRGEDRVIDVIDAIMKIVVEERLLRIEKDAAISKTTHERKSLAICVVRNLSGIPFVSSISGPTQIIMHCDAIENVILTKNIIRYLFLDVITAGKKKQDDSHMLKPLALEVLGSLVESAVQSGDTNLQLACVKAITNCHPRFDSLTKTRTISDLLFSSNDMITTESQYEFWEKYLAHLESKFLELSSSEDTSTEAQGYVELIYSYAKHILHNLDDGDEQDHKIIAVKRVLGFFMSIAFFDCSTLTKSKKKVKGKKGKNAFSNIGTITQSALKIQACLKDEHKIVYPIRVMVSSRFFSLMSEFVMTLSHNAKDGEKANVEKDSNTLAALEEIYENWIELESKKACRFVPSKEDDDDEDSPERVIKDLLSKVVDLKENTSVDKNSISYQSKKRCITGIAVLAIVLQLHRLSCGSDDDEMDDNPDADDEEDEENICNAIAELEDVSSNFFEAKEEESNPLLGLSEICANILSSPLGSGDIGRGAAPKLVREAIKYAWLGGLKLASTTATKEETPLDNGVVSLLMDAIGASNSNEDISEDHAGMDDVEDTDGSDGESDDDLIFSKASKVLDDSEDTEDQAQEYSEKENDESDIELDPTKLHSMLEDDNLDDLDDIELEHHEGADAALAKLIQLKQNSRKAGQEAREKIETSNQLRCTLLIDLLLGRPDPWNKLFQSNIILQMIVPLLDCRKRLGISAARILEGGDQSGAGDKKALLQRLTSLIKQKLSKIRLSSMPLSSPIDMNTATHSLKYILKEAKNANDKDLVSCYSSSLIFVLRMIPSSPELVSFVSTEYGDLVSEWSTKRNNGASLVEALISQMPALAQASLFNAISSATQDARGFYLKLEAYRLLSLLFANKPNAEGSSEIGKIALAEIHKSQDNLLSNINKTLNDQETIKPKLARVVFKAFENMLPFVSSPASSKTRDSMAAIKIEISSLGGKHAGLNMIAEKLVEQINLRLEALKTAPATPMGGKNNTKPSSSAKKSKKKKKKKH